MCNCDDAQQVSVSSVRHADAGIRHETGANSSRPDTCGIAVPQYEELLQCIKRQENEIAQLRQAHRQKSNTFIGASKYSHRSNKPPVDSGLHYAPASSKASTQSRSDLCQCPQKAQAPDFNKNHQRHHRREARKRLDHSSSSSADSDDDRSASNSDNDIHRLPATVYNARDTSDNRRRLHRRQDKAHTRRRNREKTLR